MPEQSMYEKMKAKGIDMSWYLRGKRQSSTKPVEAPLSDSECAKASIYLLKKNGTLWTVAEVYNDGRYSGTPYKQVRNTGKQIPHDVFVCVKCKTQFKEYADSLGHSEGGQANV